MRLKQLEIKGFKSFADKTIVRFDEGITGIIGPNGCGKSNIIDSIRWVIGEQKISSLRSENLEALVFNGSKTRSSSGLAEVSLTFENTKNLLPTEFSTITVTRKFYKSGESEYRLNDVQCRLKDIHNLFMDTGISTDSYAIIELGMVDEIIKDKENSRRRMLEQAAGITIYKTRKKEAKSKLDATEQDLARIDDLLFEINNQLKTVENQAKKAEKYYELKKEYKEVAIELAKAALSGFNLSYQELTAKQETLTNQKVELEAQVATGEAKVEKEKVVLIDKERLLQAQMVEFNQLQKQLTDKENEKKLTQQSLVFQQEKQQSLQKFLDVAQNQVVHLNENIASLKVQVEQEEKEMINLSSGLTDTKQLVEESKYLVEEKKQDVEKTRTEFFQVQRKLYEVEKNVAVADASIQNINRTVFQLEEEKRNRESEIQKLQSEVEIKEEELAFKKADLAELQEFHQKTKEQILHSQSELEGFRSEHAIESRKLDAKKNEFALLKNLIDSMEGYPESVKFLHQNKDWNYKAPILSDIIYVQQEYRAAIENVLDAYLNYYVVNDVQDGLKAISLLDEKQKGKANFFVLSNLNQFQYQALEKPAQAVSALDVIEVDEPYLPLAKYLLGHVFITENIQESTLSNNVLHTQVVIEKSGKVVRGAYTVSGGSVGIFEGNKIGRSKNLEKLQEEIVLIEAQVNAIKLSIQKKHEEVIDYNNQLKENQIKQTEQEINALINQVFSIKNKLENFQVLQLNAQKKIDDLQDRLLSEQDQVLDSKEAWSELNAGIQNLSNQLKEKEVAFKLTEQDYTQRLNAFNDQTLQITKQQSKINSLKQEIQFKSNQLAEIEKQITENLSQLEEISQQSETNKGLLIELEELIIELLRKKESEEKQLSENERIFLELRSIVQELESELKQKQKQREACETELNEIKDKLNELKLQLSSIKERLQIEFKVNIDEVIKEERNTELSIDELQQNTDKIKKRIENLGDVNPTAIEAFQEMKKRYEFILEQKNDLVSAKDSLLQTIQEVEAKANQQFLETFNKVKDNFQKVFKALFTEEDTADLILENPDNLAETSIDIIAKPKGKRPSSITQLSGGEKTLTATALLFSIYLIKPAPFCILDEVDAPLDDANVGKFTKMIQKFSENSQFIIVTHNKMTMSTVDVIYGVTMQEPGVSKLVPVDFRNLN